MTSKAGLDMPGVVALPATLLTWGGVIQAQQLVGPLDLLQAHGLLLLEHAVRVHGGSLQEAQGIDGEKEQGGSPTSPAT